MRKLVFFLFVLLWTVSAHAQLTTEGTDFWFSYLSNDDGEREIFLDLYVSSREDANIQLSNASGSYLVEEAVAANTSILIEVPIEFMAVGEGKFQTGLHLTSDVPVSVYALNKGIFTADAAVIYPTPVLGQKYYVMAHREPDEDIEPSAKGSVAMVLSTADNTKVAITPSVTTDNGWPAGETREITLNQGETYQLESDLADLTGTLIEVVDNGSGDLCSNVAVFGGNKFTNVGGCGGNRDHLYEQMAPVNTWGTRFLWVTYETRSGGDFMKVTASEDNTRVTIPSLGNITLDAGETETIKALNNVQMISADKPVQVAQFSRSADCDDTEDADPFMIMLSPMAQRITQATFDLFTVDQISKYYITLITAPGGDRDVTLDGEDISDRFRGTPGANYASFEIAKGVHTIAASEGIIAYVYGYGFAESFGYSAGASLASLNVEIEGLDPVLEADVIGEEACINSPIAFDALFEEIPNTDPTFTTFDWDFGDGSTGSGRRLTHAYNQAGTYDVTLVASDGASTCGGNVETIIGRVTILDVDVDEEGIVGTTSVCPEVEEVVYTISGDSRNTYEWEVVGGEIVGANTGTEIKVNWGLTNADAYVQVIPISGLGCRGNPIRHGVTINTRLDPALPIGNLEVCFGDLENSVYSTPNTPGSQYEWFIEGGSILSGALTHEIVVQWDDVRSGRIWYREFNPDIADCEGTSGALDITIFPGIVVEETIAHVACFGDASGSISLDISGGRAAPYTVSWSNGMSGAQISGLQLGTYTATIQDNLGCQLLREYVVEGPEELIIANPLVQNVRCFGEANGSIAVDVSGGTQDADGNYRFTWTSDNFNRTSTQPFIDDLTDGLYELVVTDANGCTVTASYLIEEPLLLEADLLSLINEPICPNASDGTAYLEAKGGTPDYQFFWSNDPTNDEQLGQNFSEGSYTVRIVDANGCVAEETIEVTERFPKIYLPNAFSPNGDDENDTFKVVADCNLNFTMQIFNEWGSVAFATSDITEGWDGRVDGQDAPIGKYSYVIFYSGTINGVSFEETLNGTLRLLR